MTAYDLSEIKLMIIKQENYLSGEIDTNNTETVLLTNNEISKILDIFSACKLMIDDSLRKR